MEVLKGSILSRSSHGKDAGRRIIIETWLEQQNVQNYTINDDFTIDVDGDVNLFKTDLIEIPDYIQFGVIRGNFDCSSNHLSSLRGCPREVGGYFYCSDNNLTSLEGSPEKVKEGFYCGSNQLTSLEGAPREVDEFYCNNNQLTSLEGAPREVGGDFYCSNNKVQFTEEDVRKVCSINGRIIY